ncbi:MAG TPA: YdeI/OmpD-associated family protein [Anaerolineales bacterium]
MKTTNPKVDAYIRQAKEWQDEFKELRRIALASPLTEDVKWGQPCYTYEGRNVAILQGFKDYCAIMFFKGTLLKDPRHILQAPGASQVARQARFTDVQGIRKLEPVLKAYLLEAIEVEKAGSKVSLKKTSDFAVPEEFQAKLDKSPALKKAFDALTPGRQRGYLFYFADAKQSATRAARVEKCIPRILKGRGLND